MGSRRKLGKSLRIGWLSRALRRVGEIGVWAASGESRKKGKVVKQKKTPARIERPP